MKKLIIIPAFNEEANIRSTVRSVEKTDFDYVIINDGSTDSTGKICEEEGFNTIHLPVNLGIGAAVQTGYRYAKLHGYDVAVQVDGDGQHDTSFLNEMTEVMMREDADMVIGSRFLKKEGDQSSSARRTGIRFFTWLIKRKTGQEITDPTSGLRIIGRKGISVFADYYPQDYPEPETTTLLLSKGMKVVEIPVRMRARQGGRSSISFRRAVYYMIKVTLAVLVNAGAGR